MYELQKQLDLPPAPIAEAPPPPAAKNKWVIPVAMGVVLIGLAVVFGAKMMKGNSPGPVEAATSAAAAENPAKPAEPVAPAVVSLQVDSVPDGDFLACFPRCAGAATVRLR